MRLAIFERDAFTCQFCGRTLIPAELTIDHLVPLSRGGLDEPTNYITSCRACNEAKAALPLGAFSKGINIQIDRLPVHGDPVIDNGALPIQIRLLRKRIFDKVRAGDLSMTGKTAQKKLERAFRTAFWQTSEGKALEAQFPLLPGQCRVMIQEIQTIAKSTNEFLLLVELAKSANTRNLIGTLLVKQCNIFERMKDLLRRSSTETPLRKRLEQALIRSEKEVRKCRLASTPEAKEPSQ